MEKNYTEKIYSTLTMYNDNGEIESENLTKEYTPNEGYAFKDKQANEIYTVKSETIVNNNGEIVPNPNFGKGAKILAEESNFLTNFEVVLL